MRKEFLFIALYMCLASTVNAAEQQPRLNCDSTCIAPMVMDQPKVNIATTQKDVGQFQWGPKCGASAGSVLPSAPSTFLCDNNGTPSAVTSTTADGETKYSWTCTNPGGSQIGCTAEKREVGSCGSSNGQTLSSNPSNLCSGGSALDFALLGSSYQWFCQGNYGPKTSCSATYYNPPPPDPGPGSGGSCSIISLTNVDPYVEASTGRTCSGSYGVEKCYWGNGLYVTSGFSTVRCY